MNTCILIITGVLTRLLFLSHGVASVVVLICFQRQHSSIYWCLLIPMLCLIPETVLTLWKQKNTQFRYFWPSGFLYVATMIPLNWVIENEFLYIRLQEQNDDPTKTNTVSNNTEDIWKNRHELMGICDKVTTSAVYPKQLCETGMFVVLLIGRWLIPRGSITREQLSALLLGFIGSTADILEIFELFKEQNIKNNSVIVYTAMSLFSLATIQFTLVTTATDEETEEKGLKELFAHSMKGNRVLPSLNGLKFFSKENYIQEVQKQEHLKINTRKRGHGKKPPNQSNLAKKIAEAEAERKRKIEENKRNMSAELFQILAALLMQDCPFLILRLYVAIAKGVASEMHVFFTCKNILVVSLLLYRLLVLNCEGVDVDNEWYNEVSLAKLQQVQNAREKVLAASSVNSLRVTSAYGSDNMVRSAISVREHSRIVAS